MNGEELMKFGMVFFVFGGAFWVVRPLFAAAAKRLAGDARPPKDGTTDAAVLEAVEQLRLEVSDLAERVDFTERMLAKQRESARLAPPE